MIPPSSDAPPVRLAARAEALPAEVPGVDPLLLTSTQVSTFAGQRLLTRASGFFFERDERLFLVTSRHVLFDRPSGHEPDRVEIVIHCSASALSQVVFLSVPLYREGRAVWRQATDAAGEVDVAAIELERPKLPGSALLHAFSPAHLPGPADAVPIGAPLLLVGFPLGFYDTVYHLPVVRHAVVASAFGIRFQSQGYFLTDARAHRGSSGAPVVMRDEASSSTLRWKLLGIHSSRMDMGSRDLDQDESLGLNCAWYADVLLALTQG